MIGRKGKDGKYHRVSINGPRNSVMDKLLVCGGEWLERTQWLPVFPPDPPPGKLSFQQIIPKHLLCEICFDEETLKQGYESHLLRHRRSPEQSTLLRKQHGQTKEKSGRHVGSRSDKELEYTDISNRRTKSGTVIYVEKESQDERD